MGRVKQVGVGAGACFPEKGTTVGKTTLGTAGRLGCCFKTFPGSTTAASAGRSEPMCADPAGVGAQTWALLAWVGELEPEA